MIFNLFLATIAGNSAFSLLQAEIRKEITLHWSDVIESDLEVLEISDELAANIRTQHSRDLLLSGQWYDVVSLKKQNGKWLLYAYADGKETDLEHSKKQKATQNTVLDWIEQRAENSLIITFLPIFFERKPVFSPVPAEHSRTTTPVFSPPELLG